MRFVSSLFVPLVLACVSLAQTYCPPGGCRIVYPPGVSAPAPGTIISIGPVVPAPPPIVKAAEANSPIYHGPLPTGVESGRLSAGEVYAISGVPVDKGKVFATLVQRQNELTDDSRKLAVSVIGGEARKDVLAGLRLRLPEGKYRFWEGEPGDWSFEPGFKTSGNPVTIYCQAPDGKVLHRQDDLAGGLDVAAEAIRKADPAYDPARDPDKRKAEVLPAIPSSVGPALLVVALGLGLLSLFRRS